MNEILLTFAIAVTALLAGYWLKREQHQQDIQKLKDGHFRKKNVSAPTYTLVPDEISYGSTKGAQTIVMSSVEKPVDKPVPRSSVQVADDVLEYALAYLYNFGAIAVAQLCDELDRSGVLLGRVRDRAYELREGEVEAPALPNKPIRREFQQFLGCPVCGHPLNAPCDHDEDPVELLRTISVSRPD